jgi:hypothetical protein
MLLKSKVKETLEDFPEKFSMDELFQKLYVIDKIQKGLEQVSNNESISEEELDIEMEGWFR